MLYADQQHCFKVVIIIQVYCVQFSIGSGADYVSINIVTFPREQPYIIGTNLTIECTYYSSSTYFPIMDWTTTALSASLNNTDGYIHFGFFGVSTLYLTDLDSGYCGEYTCNFTNLYYDSCTASADVIVGKQY